MSTYLQPHLRERGRGRSPHSPTRPNRFHSIPVELVLLIFDFLPTPDVYAFAFTCLSLHSVALQVYLDRYNSELIWGSIVCGEVARGLAAALCRPKLERLVYVHCLDGGKLGSLPDETRRRGPMLQKLLGTVDVDHIQVQLSDVYPKGGGDRAEDHLTNASADVDHGDQTAAAIGDNTNPTARLVRAIESSADEWISLLNTFILKTNCRSLAVEMVTCGTNLPSVQAIEDEVICQRYRPWTPKYLQRLLQSTVEAPKRWIGLVSTPKLERFYLHSETLFHPRLMNWTFATLGSSPSLTAVSFDQMHHFGSRTWELVLPCITIPSLKQLSINLCSVRSVDLYAFLNRHPTIEELRVGRGFPAPAAAAALPVPRRPSWSRSRSGGAMSDGSGFLPALRTLVASPEYIVAFLSSPLHPFSTIEKVVVEYRAKHVGKFTVKGVNHDLAPVCLRLKGVQEVVLHLQGDGTTVNWIVGSPSVALGLSDAATSAGVSSSRPDIHQGLTFVSSCVTTVEFKANVYVLPESIVVALPNWLSAFSKLKAFSMITLASDPYSPFASFSNTAPYLERKSLSAQTRQGSGGGRRGSSSGAAPMTLDGHSWQRGMYNNIFLSSLVKSCPGVRRVEIDGKEVELPTRRIARLR